MEALECAPDARERRIDDQGLADEVLARLLGRQAARHVGVEGPLDLDMPAVEVVERARQEHARVRRGEAAAHWHALSGQARAKRSAV